MNHAWVSRVILLSNAHQVLTLTHSNYRLDELEGQALVYKSQHKEQKNSCESRKKCFVRQLKVISNQLLKIIAIFE